MKNIHIIPTYKPSRLGRFVDTNNLFLRIPNDIPRGINVNIYITSDEEIKEGDWYYDCGDENFICKAFKHTTQQYQRAKIIITTDQDLTKNGIQAIPDEFLEWFVKNPSCEFVKVLNKVDFFSKINDKLIYKIIIPQEEPKQIYYNTVGRENGVNVVKGQFNTQKEALDLANELNRKFPDLYYDWRETLIKEEPKCLTKLEIAKNIAAIGIGKEKLKQETLEEAAEKYRNNQGLSIRVSRHKGFLDGAKWQAEKMYSEEDMKQFGLYLGDNLKKLKGKSIDEIFEQFKNI